MGVRGVGASNKGTKSTLSRDIKIRGQVNTFQRQKHGVLVTVHSDGIGNEEVQTQYGTFVLVQEICTVQ